MKIAFVLATVLAAAAAVSYEDVLVEEWNLFKADHQKSYDSALEDSRRMQVFLESKYIVAQHNLKYAKGEVTYEMEMNKFSDWLPEEMAAFDSCSLVPRNGEDGGFAEGDGGALELPPNATAPDSFNWFEKGAVAPVKNQGTCQSCYSFSAIGALETQQYLKTKKMVRLSEQNIVDCSEKYGNMGCNGGFASSTYDYIKGNGGVNTESSYPYEDKEGKCRFDKRHIGATITGYVRLEQSEDVLKNVIANIGTVSVAVNSLDSMKRYKSGVYYEPKCTTDIMKLNHAMLAVGYGTDPKTKEEYWLVKNSWGTNVGENGYIRMARNRNNNCGIATNAYYPTIPK